MPDIRINQLPPGGGPVATDFLPLDNGTTRKATVQAVVEIGRPAASQAEAESGTNPTKVMTPLTVKQSIASEVGVSIASAAQGALAATAVQPARSVGAGTGLTGGGDLSADRTIALNASSIASLALADISATIVANRTALKALSTAGRKAAAIYGEGGRDGVFLLTEGDFSAQVALDTEEGWFIKANDSPSGSRAWVRLAQIARPEFWGADGAVASTANASLVNEYTALQCMINVVGFMGGAIEISPGKKFRTNTNLFARITRQQAAPLPLNADLYISDKSSFKIYSDGTGWLVAGANMTSVLTFQFNSGAVGGVNNVRGPDQSEVCGLMIDGNGFTVTNGILCDFTRGVNIHDNTVFNVTNAVSYLGSSGGYVTNNIFKTAVGVACLAGSGGDLHIGPNQYFFPLTGGRAVKIQDSGNIVIDGGTVNSESIASVIGVEIEATSGEIVRHVAVRDMEFSGCQIGVYAHTASAADRIYGLNIEGNWTTSGSGFDRPSINPGCLVDLQHVDESTISGNKCNGALLSVASETAYIIRDCKRIYVDEVMISNYTGAAFYIEGSDRVSLMGGIIRDVGQAGTSSAMIDLDASTKTRVEGFDIEQTSASYAFTGIIERAGCSGNIGKNNRWTSAAGSSFVASAKTGATDGHFERYPTAFAQGKVSQDGTTATLTAGDNVTVARASLGRCTVTFVNAHPNISYHADPTGIGCKVETESIAAGSFVVLMLDLADNPVDSSFSFNVRSLI